MQRIFAADIGGTNARFALFTEYEGNLTLMSAVWAKSADLGNARDVLQAMQQLLQSPFSAGDSLVIALAGPVKGLRGRLTNGRLRVDLDGVAQQYNLACCLLLNDFSAQAFATLTPCGTTAAVVRSSPHPLTVPAQPGPCLALALALALPCWCAQAGLALPEAGWPCPRRPGMRPLHL